MTYVILLILAAIFIIAFIIYQYNNLIRLKNKADEAFSGISVQLKKRYDLIPNLVATVKAYMVHEKSLLENITAYRSRMLSGGDMSREELFKADQVSGEMLRNIMIAVENYPQLKANENIDQLQRSINEIESQLSAARRTYNAMSRCLNDAIGIFPSSIFAHFMKMTPVAYIEIPEKETETPDVGRLFAN